MRTIFSILLLSICLCRWSKADVSHLKKHHKEHKYLHPLKYLPPDEKITRKAARVQIERDFDSQLSNQAFEQGRLQRLYNDPPNSAYSLVDPDTLISRELNENNFRQFRNSKKRSRSNLNTDINKFPSQRLGVTPPSMVAIDPTTEVMPPPPPPDNAAGGISAGAGAVPTEHRSYTNAPNSIFHNQLNYQSQDNDYNAGQNLIYRIQGNRKPYHQPKRHHKHKHSKPKLYKQHQAHSLGIRDNEFNSRNRGIYLQQKSDAQFREVTRTGNFEDPSLGQDIGFDPSLGQDIDFDPNLEQEEQVDSDADFDPNDEDDLSNDGYNYERPLVKFRT